jgi:hypothetical protein
VAAVAVLMTKVRVVVLVAMAVLVSSSSLMLAHNNFLVVLSLLLAVTPFTHLRLLARLAQSQRCPRLI